MEHCTIIDEKEEAEKSNKANKRLLHRYLLIYMYMIIHTRLHPSYSQ